MGRKMNANGRFLGGETPEGRRGSTVKGKGTPVLGSEFSQKPGETCNFPKRIFRRGLFSISSFRLPE